MEIFFKEKQMWLIASAIILFLTSLTFHLKSKFTLSLVFLVLSSIALFSFAALLDPFLNLWDERFHALVGKNLMQHPLMPALYDDPVLDMDYNRWDKAHIWLHKQPLFLWQIALSFKVFGISEFSLRIPDILLSTIIVAITYRSTRLLAGNRAAFISATLLLSTVYLLELISGRQELEHNDISFLAYVSLSLWSLIEYQHSGKKFWILLIGLFAGMAILCKWLTGLLVYFVWIILKFLAKKFHPAEFADVLKSLLVTLAIALPWQILCLVWYPAEAKEAFHYNSIHFTQVLEGHGGDFRFHFDLINTLYGPWINFVLIPAIVVFLWKSEKKKIAFSLVCAVVFVYLFFSFAATKMPSFTLMVAMPVIIILSAGIDHLFSMLLQFVKRELWIQMFFVFIIIGLIFWRFDVGLLQERHSSKQHSNQYIENQIHNRKVFVSLNLPKEYVLFNVKGRHYVEAMFYTGLPAYNTIPTKDQFQNLKEKGRKIALFLNKDIQLPDYLKSDKDLVLLPVELKGDE